MDFLKEDLKNLFSETGVDQSQYDAVVKFRDPITSYNDVKGERCADLGRTLTPATAPNSCPGTQGTCSTSPCSEECSLLPSCFTISGRQATTKSRRDGVLRFPAHAIWLLACSCVFECIYSGDCITAASSD